MRKFKSFFHKSDLNYEHDKISAEEFHCLLYVLIRSYNFDKDGKHYWWSKPLSIFVVTSNIMAIIVSFDGIFKLLQNVEFVEVTEVGMYMLLLGYESYILITTKFDRQHYFEFQKMLEQDFEDISNENLNLRKSFFADQLNTWKIVLCLFLFTTGASLWWNVVPFLWLFWYLMTSSKTKPLIFPFTSSFSFIDYNKSPFFEIAFCLQLTFMLGFAINYTIVQYVHMLVIGHIIAKANLIKNKIDNVMDGISAPQNSKRDQYNKDVMENRMKNVVKLHYSLYKLIDHYSSIFRKFLMVEQFLSIPVVCLSAYAAAERWDDGEIHLVLITVCMASIVQMVIPCYACTIMGIKVESVRDACWDMPIWNGVTPIRLYILLIMQRSQKLLPLYYGGMLPVDLETFSEKMGSAYTLFNILRQTGK